MLLGKPGLHIMSLNYLNKNSIGPFSKNVKQTEDSIKQNSLYLRYNYLGEI